MVPDTVNDQGETIRDDRETAEIFSVEYTEVAGANLEIEVVINVVNDEITFPIYKSGCLLKDFVTKQGEGSKNVWNNGEYFKVGKDIIPFSLFVFNFCWRIVLCLRNGKWQKYLHRFQYCSLPWWPISYKISICYFLMSVVIPPFTLHNIFLNSGNLNIQ